MNYKFHYFFYCCGRFFKSFVILFQFSHPQPILKPLYGNKFWMSKHASHLKCKESAQGKNFLYLKINPLLYETNIYGLKYVLRPFTASCQLLKWMLLLSWAAQIWIASSTPDKPTAFKITASESLSTLQQTLQMLLIIVHILPVPH